jgi:predicted DNA-binding transcriptional regulator YafY
VDKDKVYRQAALCALLREGPGVYAMDALAARLGVHVRTIQRDVQELSRRGAGFAREGNGIRLAALPEDLVQPAPPATEREVRWLTLLRFVYEEPGSFEPGRLSQTMARRFEVSERTIARDLESLEARGLIEVRNGRRHPGRAFLPALRLTSDQVLALLDYLDIQEQLMPRGAVLRNAEEKLRSCLLGEAARVANRRAGTCGCARLVKGRYYLQSPEIEERVDLLERACHGRCRARFEYAPQRGEPGWRVVEPLGLIYYWFQDAWYLVAGSCAGTGQAGEIRHFRLDRMGEVEVTGEEFAPPADFDLQRHTAPCWGVEHGELHKVRIRFHDEYNVLSRLRRETAHRAEARVEAEPGGDSVIYSDEVAGLHEIRVWVRGFGGSAEVLEPEQLRREVVESVQRIVERYGQASPGCPDALGLIGNSFGLIGNETEVAG